MMINCFKRWWCKEPPKVISPKVISLGWINVYKKSNGQLVITMQPKKHRYLAQKVRSRDPVSTYLYTTEIFTYG